MPLLSELCKRDFLFFIANGFINLLLFSANGFIAPQFTLSSEDSVSLTHNEVPVYKFSPEVEKALIGVQFIAQHIRDNDKDNEVMEDWKYMAMVLDKLFLWLFTLTCLFGTCFIILRAPSLYDMREPIDARLTSIGN